MKLKAKKQTFYVVDYEDLEDYLANLWRHKKFKIFPPQNDVYVEIHVKKNDSRLFWQDTFNYSKLKGTAESYDLGDIFQGLIMEDRLPEGKYLINFSW